VRDALDLLIEKGRSSKKEEVKVVVLGGGPTYDISLSLTSGAITRKLNFHYFCYDNEAYGNTGVQFSPATAYGARTTTAPCAMQHQAGTMQEKKDTFEIPCANKSPSMATVSPRYPLELEEKFLHAEEYTGRKL